MYRNIGILSILLIIIPIGSATDPIENFSSIEIPTLMEDLDPLVDVVVTVDILKIRSLEKKDPHVNAIEKIDWGSDPDFYVKVYINDVKFTSQIWRNQKYIDNVNWQAKLNVPDNVEFVSIRIELWDWNPGLDQKCDISSVNYDSGKYKDSFGVDLIYSISTGHWWGDDFAYYEYISADPSGYGRLNGCDDGSIYQRERDCELWFTITQSDYDNDGVPYWTEKNVYHTDPKICDIGTDEDNDDIPLEWEHKWGHFARYHWRNRTYYHKWIYLPFEWNDHKNLDPDEDGLDNYEEYLVSEWDSDPFRKDIYLEIDQMEKGPNGEGNYLPEVSKDLITTAFNRRNIVLHIDDGCMGGGQKNLPFERNTSDQNLKTLYHNFFLNGNSNYWRKGVFHYALIIYHSERYPGFVFLGEDNADSLQLSTKAHDKIARRYPIVNRFMWRNFDMEEMHATVYAGALMHETGHTLGIFHGNTPGCDDQEGKYPYQINYWRWRSYKSVMNYGYVYKIVDYSDGSRGKNDFNDWGRIDLTRFQMPW